MVSLTGVSVKVACEISRGGTSLERCSTVDSVKVAIREAASNRRRIARLYPSCASSVVRGAEIVSICVSSKENKASNLFPMYRIDDSSVRAGNVSDLPANK